MCALLLCDYCSCKELSQLTNKFLLLFSPHCSAGERWRKIAWRFLGLNCVEFKDCQITVGLLRRSVGTSEVYNTRCWRGIFGRCFPPVQWMFVRMCLLPAGFVGASLVGRPLWILNDAAIVFDTLSSSRMLADVGEVQTMCGNIMTRRNSWSTTSGLSNPKLLTGHGPVWNPAGTMRRP